jgi:hypothetical protein
MSEYLRKELSKNEQDFNKKGPIFTYRNVPVYKYEGGLTFWFGSHSSEYVSSIETKEDAIMFIDKEFTYKNSINTKVDK